MDDDSNRHSVPIASLPLTPDERQSCALLITEEMFNDNTPVSAHELPDWVFIGDLIEIGDLGPSWSIDDIGDVVREGEPVTVSILSMLHFIRWSHSPFANRPKPERRPRSSPSEASLAALRTTLREFSGGRDPISSLPLQAEGSDEGDVDSELADEIEDDDEYSTKPPPWHVDPLNLGYQRLKEPAWAPPSHGMPRQLSVRVLALLGQPPLTDYEATKDYYAVMSSFAQTIVPEDDIEWFWIKDITDLTWESRRLRRSKAVILALGRHSALFSILEADVQGSKSIREARDDQMEEIKKLNKTLTAGMLVPKDFSYLQQEQANDYLHDGVREQEEVAPVFKRYGLRRGDIEANAYAHNIDKLDRIERMIAFIDRRRDSLLREIPQRRRALALLDKREPKRKSKS